MSGLAVRTDALGSKRFALPIPCVEADTIRNHGVLSTSALVPIGNLLSAFVLADCITHLAYVVGVARRLVACLPGSRRHSLELRDGCR